MRTNMRNLPPTLEDVAKVAGVSRATVSRVINGVRNVDQDIQEVVRRAVEKTGYTPNRAARSLVTRRTGNVALIVCGAGGDLFGDPFFGRVVSGVVDYLREHNAYPLLMLADDDATRAHVMSHLRAGTADGALVVTTDPDDRLPMLLQVSGLPAVGFSRTARPLSYVDVRHWDGGQLAAEHLVGQGCERPVTISGPWHVEASRERIAGFCSVVGDAVPNVEGNFTMASGEAAMEQLLRTHPDLDAVFAANDLMARGALKVLQARGIGVPEKVLVVGFDDSSAAVAAHPRLTTVRQPVEEMAALMAKMLLEDIEAPTKMPRTMLFEPKLVVRDSA